MSIKALMIDLSGTVHVGDTLIPGAKNAIFKLKKSGIPLKYVTNSSKESKTSLLMKLEKAGLEVTVDDVFTSLSAARSLISSKNLRPMLILENEAMQDFQGIETSDPDCVVVGLATSQFEYHKLNAAFRLIKSGAPLIAINKSRYFKQEDGLALGTGAFVSALEFASDCQAHVVGKPEADFFNLALKDMLSGVPACETLMVGDDVRDDVLGAQKAGLSGALVKTGKYQPGDENRYGNPDYVFENLEEMADFVIQQYN